MPARRVPFWAPPCKVRVALVSVSACKFELAFLKNTEQKKLKALRDNITATTLIAHIHTDPTPCVQTLRHRRAGAEWRDPPGPRETPSLGSFTHVNILFVAEQARVRTLAIRHYGGARTPAVAGESAT